MVFSPIWVNWWRGVGWVTDPAVTNRFQNLLPDSTRLGYSLLHAYAIER